MHELSQGRIPYGSGGVRLPVDVLQTVGHEVLQYAAQQNALLPISGEKAKKMAK